MDATSPFQLCGHAGCLAAPVDPASGGPGRSTIRKWFCPEHLAEQTDRDRLPLAPRLTQRPGGGFVDVDELELESARGAAAAASQHAREEAHLAEAQLAQAELDAHEQAQRDQLIRELPAVYRGVGA